MSLYDKLALGFIGGGGAKVNKVFSLKPTNGSGDLYTGRNGTAYRRDSSGQLVITPANYIRADYKDGRTCPAYLVEPQSTNLITYSEAEKNYFNPLNIGMYHSTILQHPPRSYQHAQPPFS